LTHEELFRIGIATDLLIVVCGIILALALYVMTRPADKTLALLALCLMLTESVLAAVVVSFSFIALQLFNGRASSTVFSANQLRDLFGLWVSFHAPAATVTMVFVSLGYIIYLYLMFKSGCVPKILSGFGIFSYSLLLVYSFVTILWVMPAIMQMGNVDVLCMAPSCLFELTIGCWLLVKGVNVRREINSETRVVF